jgi:hypothetical protein
MIDMDEIEMIDAGTDPIDTSGQSDESEGTTEDGTPVPSEYDSERETAS